MADEKKSVLGSITGTFKSELKNNVLDKLGPNLGSSIEKALEAKAQGKNFKDTFSSEYKSRLAESWKDKIFGQGIIGKSLRAGFEAKFGSSEKVDPNEPVLGSTFNDFSESITKSIEDEQGVLIRIETLATNISDNVYNITAAWSKNAQTLEETRRIQEEQHKLEMMSAEEAALEARSQIEPLSKPTPTGKENDKPGTGLSGISNMFSGLLKSAGKLKSSLSGILKSKKFLALAALTIGSSAAAAIISGNEPKDIPDNTTETPKKLNSNSEPQKAVPALTEQDKQEAVGETEKLLKLSKVREQTSAVTNNVTNLGPTNSTSNVTNLGPANSTNNVTNQNKTISINNTMPVSKPLLSSVSLTTPNVTSSPGSEPGIQMLNDYFQKPENAADSMKVQELSEQENTINNAIEQTRILASTVLSPNEKARYEYIIKTQLEPSLQVVKNQKQEIINRAKQSLQGSKISGQNTNYVAPSPVQLTTSVSVAPTAGEAGPAPTPTASSSSPPSLAPTPTASSSSSSSPTMMGSNPTSGSGLAATSEAVESSATKPNKPTITNIDNSSQNMESREGRTRRGIPSPVANRGSLDKMSFFGG